MARGSGGGLGVIVGDRSTRGAASGEFAADRAMAECRADAEPPPVALSRSHRSDSRPELRSAAIAGCGKLRSALSGSVMRACACRLPRADTEPCPPMTFVLVGVEWPKRVCELSFIGPYFDKTCAGDSDGLRCGG
jgi:hypothetical protein